MFDVDPVDGPCGRSFDRPRLYYITCISAIRRVYCFLQARLRHELAADGGSHLRRFEGGGGAHARAYRSGAAVLCAVVVVVAVVFLLAVVVLLWL